MATSTKHETKKNEILQSGVELLWESGFNGVSVKDIVQAAGIPKGSFYFYFNSKEDFVLKALESYLQYSNSITEGILEEKSTSPLKRLRNFYERRGKALGSGECRKGCMLTNLSTEMAGQNEAIRSIADNAFQSAEGPVATCLQDAIDAGEVSNQHSAEDLAEFMESTWRGVSVTAKVKQDNQVISRTIDFFFNHILK